MARAAAQALTSQPKCGAKNRILLAEYTIKEAGFRLRKPAFCLPPTTYLLSLVVASVSNARANTVIRMPEDSRVLTARLYAFEIA